MDGSEVSAMATKTLVPLREYLETTYHPDCEWIDGELRERNLGEGQHSVVQGFFIVLFHSHRQEWQVRVFPELRVQTSATHYRIPDICVTRKSSPFEAIVHTPPLLCIEILSPDDRMSEMQEKVDDYLQMGVEMVWVVDPRRRKAFQTDGRSLQPVEELAVHATAIRVPVPDVFAELNELEGVT
jgi:Uma2 family endonuclease